MAKDDKESAALDSQLNELRKKAYKKPDPYGTTIEGAQTARDLALPIGRHISLEVIEGPRKGLNFNFEKGNIVIGRAQEADLFIEDSKISRKHCIIEAFARDLIYIADLASTNGTFINGMRVRSTKLKDKDRIQVGNTVLIFHLEDEGQS
jgi:pSer/pThr/pTyr-binding forkhead associated (FHA) protein